MNTILQPSYHGLEAAAHFLRDGAVIAYPTEAVFGLGCDPFNRDAVFKLLSLKSRREQKGLLLIASHFDHLKPLIALDELSSHQINQALVTWPGPYTWVFPASAMVPSWIRGDFSSVAVRVTNHPVAKALCNAFGKPLVSTSANIDGCIPARTVEQVLQSIPKGIHAIIDGNTGSSLKPTQIRDVVTGKVIRFG